MKNQLLIPVYGLWALMLTSVCLDSLARSCGGEVLYVSGFESVPDCASWHIERDNNGHIIVDSLSNYGDVIFENELSHEQIYSDFPIGHNLPAVANRIFYNLYLDGYGGLPLGSCPKRSYLMDIDDPTRQVCEANENKDLFRVWAGNNPLLQQVLLKNMTIKNAFRSYNTVDGVIVIQPNQLPHTDTFQAFFGGSSVEEPEWLVIQDSLIKNSDNNLMVTGNMRFKGFLYQNLTTSCDQWFLDDVSTRVINDYKEFNPGEIPSPGGCRNAMGASSSEAAPVWLVESYPSNSMTGRIGVSNQGAEVVVIGANWQSLRVTTRNQNNQIVDHPNVHRYRYIEEALKGPHQRPPFLHLSCAGWRQSPLNCESHRGFQGIHE